MGRHFSAGPRGGLPQAERERRESEREYYELPSVAVGRFVLSEPVSSQANGAETLFDYRNRVVEENQDKTGLQFVQGPLFAPLFRPEEFQAIVEDSRTGRSKPGMRRTQYETRSAKRSIAQAFQAARNADAELAATKAETARAMIATTRAMIERGDLDPGTEDDLLLSEDPSAYQKWGERRVGLRPQPRVSDSNTMGFAIQLDSDLDSSNSQAIQAMRSSGLGRGLALNPPNGSQIIDLVKTERPIAQTSIGERPILPRPPASILLGPLVITEL